MSITGTMAQDVSRSPPAGSIGNSSSSSVPSLYAELDVSPSVSAIGLTKQYRRLSLMYHPDRLTHRTDVKALDCQSKKALLEKYQAITAAYKVLSDPKKRTKYDAQHAVNFSSRAQAVREVIDAYSSPKKGSSSPTSSTLSHGDSETTEKTEIVNEWKGGSPQQEIFSDRFYTSRTSGENVLLSNCSLNTKGSSTADGNTEEGKNEEGDDIDDDDEEYDPQDVKVTVFSSV